MDHAITARLAASGIQFVAETAAHYLFTRDDCIALVERRDNSFGTISSTGMMTAHGLSYLIWRDGQAFLKSKSAEIPANQEQIAAVRRFSQDLASALG